MSDQLTEPKSENRWSDIGRLLILVGLALTLRIWVITHAEVGARDSIGFIRYALHLDEKPWAEVIRTFDQHPGYPICVWAVSLPVRQLAGGVNCDSMLLAAQIASLLASLLTIVPIYFVGKTLFGREAGLGAAAVWQCLPVCLHATADGLSEATFLMFVSWSLLAAVAGFRRSSVWWFLVCGFAGGLAYLTRPEGGEVVVATGLVLAVFGLMTWGWKATALRFVGLAAGAVPCVALYVGITGNLTNKPTGRDVLNGGALETAVGDQARAGSAILVAAFWSSELQSGQSRSLWGAKTLLLETGKSAHYFGPLFAILGIWWFRQRLRHDPALWLLLLLMATHALLLWRMAVIKGYLSERHTLLLVLMGIFWIGAAFPRLGRGVAMLSPALARWVPLSVALVFMVSGLPSALKPLHVNRAGLHAAGRWIAAHGSPSDEVVDPFCWAHFYAGCVFREGKVVPPPEHTRYVVVEKTGNAHARLPLMPTALALADRGERVYHWPEQRPPEQATVVVYRVAPGR